MNTFDWKAVERKTNDEKPANMLLLYELMRSGVFSPHHGTFSRTNVTQTNIALTFLSQQIQETHIVSLHKGRGGGALYSSLPAELLASKAHISRMLHVSRLLTYKLCTTPELFLTQNYQPAMSKRKNIFINIYIVLYL